MASRFVGVVTGANRGIGRYIVEQLCEKLGGRGVVVLACRDLAAGERVRNEILSQHPGSEIIVAQLDVADGASIERFSAGMQKSFPEGLDLLVNNAGFAYPGESKEVPFIKQATDTLGVNYFGTLHLMKALVPAMRPSSFSSPEPPRIVNVASLGGQMAFRGLSEPLRRRFVEARTESDVTALMEEFMKDVRDGVHSQKGWPTTAYGVSKLGLITLTQLTKAPGELASWVASGGRSTEGTIVMSFCPGWCITDMSVAVGRGEDMRRARTAAHGAAEAVHLGLPTRLGGDSRDLTVLRGKFVRPQQPALQNLLATPFDTAVNPTFAWWENGALQSHAHGGRPCPPEPSNL